MVRQLGPYVIEREIGRGGMGVVYLGRDPRLDRPVAIKVLPDLFAGDPERLARFEREARLLAALTHAHIAGIYGIEESGGQRFLVLEYVEGETLAERLERGPLGIDETLDVCSQIAAALEAAHEAGIVHRDLKPGNVKLTPSGEVKVLDFGLAKGGPPSPASGSDLSQSPTITRAATGMGVILGTAAYMSPEQARGRAVDRRTDIWSFGCVLYECLTGQQTFAGETVSDMIASILQGAPDLSKLPSGTPDRLRALLSRCLEKDARRRLRDIGDARIEIEDIQSLRRSGASGELRIGALPQGTAAVPLARTPWALPAGALALIVVGALAGGSIARWRWSGDDAPPLRFTILAPAHADMDPDGANNAISPDGRWVAFVAEDSAGQASLWIRPLGELESRPLAQTRGASLPFWSQDSRQVAFFADGKLKRIRISGGNPETICDAPSGRGGTWNRGGVIVFAGNPGGPLTRVPASGGSPVPVTRLDTKEGETAHRWPCFLPDGQHFLYTALPAANGQYASYIGSLGSMDRAPLLRAAGGPVYAHPGYLVFMRNQSLMAQPFDGHRVRGEPMTVGDVTSGTVFSAAPLVSASARGTLAWPNSGSAFSRIAWWDRNGHEIGDAGLPPDRWGIGILSPDDRRAQIQRTTETGSTEVWLLDLLRQTSSRVTSGHDLSDPGVFSPDGREMLVLSNRSGARNLYRRPADGSGTERPFYESPVPFKTATDWSPDGKWVVLEENGDSTQWNLYLIPADGGPRRPYLVTPYNEENGVISPDGRWLLYLSDESGSLQLYVQSFPEPGNRQQVSRTGAIIGWWNRSGREIIVLRPDLSVVSIAVTPGPEPAFGAPHLLFQLPPGSRWVNPTSDAQRFLVNIPAEKSQTGIAVAVNWRSEHEP